MNHLSNRRPYPPSNPALLVPSSLSRMCLSGKASSSQWHNGTFQHLKPASLWVLVSIIIIIIIEIAGHWQRGVVENHCRSEIYGRAVRSSSAKSCLLSLRSLPSLVASPIAMCYWLSCRSDALTPLVFIWSFFFYFATSPNAIHRANDAVLTAMYRIVTASSRLRSTLACVECIRRCIWRCLQLQLLQRPQTRTRDRCLIPTFCCLSRRIFVPRLQTAVVAWCVFAAVFVRPACRKCLCTKICGSLLLSTRWHNHNAKTPTNRWLLLSLLLSGLTTGTSHGNCSRINRQIASEAGRIC